jgi:tetrahydromethanopterin S-methyltransferase subunit H
MQVKLSSLPYERMKGKWGPIYYFSIDQKVCDIWRVKFGRKPGEYPAVVCSSIFQKREI